MFLLSRSPRDKLHIQDSLSLQIKCRLMCLYKAFSSFLGFFEAVEVKSHNTCPMPYSLVFNSLQSCRGR